MKIGDIVYLKSGSPPLKIADFDVKKNKFMVEWIGGRLDAETYDFLYYSEHVLTKEEPK